jgi:small subunit ribosomal protein S6
MPLYECVVLGRQELSSTQIEALDATIVDCLTAEKAQVLKKESWGTRQLAYKINKNKKAHYLYFEIDAPSPAVDELNRRLRIHDDVLRSLFVRVDKFLEGETQMMKNKDDQFRRFGSAPRAAVADQGYRPAAKPIVESEDAVQS